MSTRKLYTGTLFLGKKPLTLEQVAEVAFNGVEVLLSPEAKKRITQSHGYSG
jgi:hypothetical protein